MEKANCNRSSESGAAASATPTTAEGGSGVVNQEAAAVVSTPSTSSGSNFPVSLPEGFMPPERPESPLNAFETFYETYTTNNPNVPKDCKNIREIMEFVSQKWQSLSPEEKKAYEDLSTQAQKKYKKDLAEWRHWKENVEPPASPFKLFYKEFLQRERALHGKLLFDKIHEYREQCEKEWNTLPEEEKGKYNQRYHEAHENYKRLMSGHAQNDDEADADGDKRSSPATTTPEDG